MKKGTKIAVFIISMALTVGSLVAFVGPRHCGHHGMYRHCDAAHNNYYEKANCGSWNNQQESDTVKVN